ncbi:MAG: DUF1080 domain-containing protein [Reichenbachiella sp.]
MKSIFIFACFTIVITINACNSTGKESKTNNNVEAAWTDLLDKDLSKWDIYLGIPHKNSGIEGYEDVEDVKTGIALGLGNKNNVFSVIEENNENILKITGEIFGGLVSKQEFENYHLTFQVKWGDKKWEPRLDAKRNNGMLYHSVGAFGSGLWNTWMSSLEFEVEESNFGDYISINDANVRALSPAIKKEDGNFYFTPGAEMKSFNWAYEETGRCFKSDDYEKPFGQWNTLELYCFGDTAIHIVNGEVVMAIYQPEFYNGSDWIPMNKGKLQIQSEAAECYFKNIKIKPITAMDDKYRNYLK